MRVLTLLLSIALVAAAPAVAQAASPTPQQELDAARARWSAAGIADYAYTFRQFCFCPNNSPQEAIVRGGVAERGRTVEQLFAIVQREIDEPAAEFAARYDDAGVPVSLSVDRYAYAIDDEYGWAVENFRRLDPPPPPAVEPSPLQKAREAWRASGIRRHRLLVTRRCPGRRAYRRRDWTVPRLHAFIARRPGAVVTYGRHGIPRTIATGSCRYRITRFRRVR